MMGLEFAVSVVMQVLYQTIVVKTYLSVYIPTLSYGHELQIAIEKVMDTSGWNEVSLVSAWAQP